jgi:alpha-glucosidase
MQWDAGPNAGFCPEGVEPWLPVNPDFPQVNVAAQRDEPRSMLTLTRRLIDLRRKHPALISGHYWSIPTPDGVFAFLREQGDELFLVALNFTDQPQAVHFPARIYWAEVFLSTHLDRAGKRILETIELRPDEGVILECWTFPAWREHEK